MKCNHCRAEWNAPNSNPTNCPFCGKPLVTEVEINANMPAEQILKSIVERFGHDVFKDSRRLMGILSDWMTHDRKTLKLLKIAIDNHVPSRLLEIENFGRSEKEIEIRKLKQDLMETCFLQEKAAEYAVDCFAEVLGSRFGGYSEMTMTTGSNEVKIGLTGEIVIIDWGDGTEKEEYRNINDYIKYTHTYSDENAHTITITGENIVHLLCVENRLSSLDVSKNTALTDLNCRSNQLTSLDVSNIIALTHLNCYNNKLTNLDVSQNTALKSLFCSSNQLARVEVCNTLTKLNCDSNQLTNIDVSKNIVLIELDCNSNLLKSLDVSKNVALKKLSCINNQLTSLDISKNNALTELNCHSNKLTSLDVSKNTVLTKLHCSFNPHLTTLNISNNPVLNVLYCQNNHLTSLDISNTALTRLFSDKDCVVINNQKTTTMSMTTNSEKVGIGLTGTVVMIDWGDDTIKEEYSYVNDLIIGHTYMDFSVHTITITGKNITRLNCRCGLTSLDVSKNTMLKELDCSHNQLTRLDISKNTMLTKFSCRRNKFISLDVSNNSALTELDCWENLLASLDISKNTALAILDCSHNQLKSLDVSKNTALTMLNCSHNQLKNLDVSKNTLLASLYCSENNLTSLDVSKNTMLSELKYYSNQLSEKAVCALFETLQSENGTILIKHKTKASDDYKIAESKGWKVKDEFYKWDEF